MAGGSNPVFGAVAQLTAAQAKAQADIAVAQFKFKAALESEKARQETEMAKMKAEGAIEQGASQQQQQQTPPDLAAMFPEQPLQAVGGQQAPVSVADAIGQTANPVQGGAAVQAYLKGGGAPGPAQAPSTLTTSRESTQYEEFDRGTPYGSFYRPVTRTERTTEPNALTAGQAAQLNQQQAQFQIEQAQRQDEQRAQLTLKLADREGLSPGDAGRAVNALQRGDTAAVFDALGGSIEKANTLRAEERSLRTDQLRASIEASKSASQLNRARAAQLAAQSGSLTLDVLGGMKRGGAPVLTPAQANDALGKYVKEDKFNPAAQAAFEEVQASRLRNENKVYVLRSTGGGVNPFGAGAQFDALPAAPMVAAAQVLASERASQAEKTAALKALRSAKDSDGNALFKVSDGELSPARKENYNVLDAVLTAGQRLELMQAPSGAALPSVGVVEVEAQDSPTAKAEAPLTPGGQSGQAAGAGLRAALGKLLEGQPSDEERLFTSPQMIEGGQQIREFFKALMSDMEQR